MTRTRVLLTLVAILLSAGALPDRALSLGALGAGAVGDRKSVV